MEIVDERKDLIRIGSDGGLTLDTEGVGLRCGEEKNRREKSDDDNRDHEHGVLRSLALDIYVDINILGPCQSESAASRQFLRGSVPARRSNSPTRSATPASACRCCVRLGSPAASFRCSCR